MSWPLVEMFILVESIGSRTIRLPPWVCSRHVYELRMIKSDRKEYHKLCGCLLMERGMHLECSKNHKGIVGELRRELQCRTPQLSVTFDSARRAGLEALILVSTPTPLESKALL